MEEKAELASKDYEYIQEVPESGSSHYVTETKRGLKSRHISMIALGGTIGTGLFISTKNAIGAGPVLALISYIFVTTLAWSVTQCLGEMATYLPVLGSFIQFCSRYCSPALGAANGWNYWFSWAITYALELSVMGQIIEYWTDKVPLAVWITIFFVIITAMNLVPVKFYGEFEFWVASIKIVAVVGWLVYALCMVCGAGATGPVGFRYWRNPGAWGDGAGLVKNMNTDRFLAWLSSLVAAVFTVSGIEIVGISCGESANPRKAVPSALKKVIWRIIVFYLLTVFFMGLLIPFNDPKLQDDSAFAASSPFIVAMKNSGTHVLPSIFNAVILSAVFSTAVSNTYSGSRVLCGMAETGSAPKFFCITSRHGIPYVSVLSTASFGALGYLLVSHGGNIVFTWLQNISAVAALVAWGNISFSHIRFMQILKSRGISRDSLPFKAWGMPYNAYYSAISCFVIMFIQGYAVFFNFTASGFFTAYVSLMVFFGGWIVAHFCYNGFTRKAFTLRSWLLPLEECDIDSGKREVDDLVIEEEPPSTWAEKCWNILS